MKSQVSPFHNSLLKKKQQIPVPYNKSYVNSRGIIPFTLPKSYQSLWFHLDIPWKSKTIKQNTPQFLVNFKKLPKKIILVNTCFMINGLSTSREYICPTKEFSPLYARALWVHLQDFQWNISPPFKTQRLENIPGWKDTLL